MTDLIEQLKKEICLELGLDPERPPVFIAEAPTAQVLKLKPGTLGIWRTTGRYSLPYVKSGRLIRYRLTNVAELLADRIQGGAA